MSLANLLNSIDDKKSKLDTLRPLSKKQLDNLKNYYDIDFTYNSNAIEGSTLTYSETKIILNQGLTIGGKKLNEHLEVINHKEAIDFIESLSHLKPNEIKLKDILNIHYLILKGISTKDAGIFRKQPVGVRKSDGSIYEFVEPLRVQESMEEFILWLQNSKNLHPILLSALAHYKFVTIHPFIDGNGRSARLLMNLILLQFGYPLAIITVDKRVEYIQAIEKAQNSEDLNDFYTLIAKRVEFSLDTHIEIIQKNIKLI